MSRFVDLRFLRLIPLATLLFSARAFAQFEVAPDHFDSKPKNEAARKPATKNKVSVARPTASPALTRTNAVAAANGHYKQNAGRNAHPVADPLKAKGSAGQISPGVNRAPGAPRKPAPAAKVAAVVPQ